MIESRKSSNIFLIHARYLPLRGTGVGAGFGSRSL